MSQIWDILQIEATTDKREIKKAYARRAKEIHPEEKPEEFQMLYEAYQRALGYASFGSGGNRRQVSFDMPRKEPERESESKKTAEEQDEYERLGFDPEAAKKEQFRLKKIEYFLSRWKKYSIVWANNGRLLDEDKQYLRSESFREIMWSSVVLEAIVFEIKKYCLRKEDILLFFWDLYDFENLEERNLEGVSLQLYKVLYPAYTNRVKRQQCEENREELKKEENRRIQKLIIKIVFVLGGAAALMVGLAYFQMLEGVLVACLLAAVMIFAFWVVWHIIRG